MNNELLLFLTLIVEFTFVVLCHRFLGKSGLYMWITIATIAQNIEVLILVKAFGIEMTLGNILFASTFLVTDIVSELYGKSESYKAVRIGIITSIIFVTISSSWLAYSPSENDFASNSIRSIFSYTPRLMLASISVYVIVQFMDVWLYHRWWKFTTEKFGDKKKFLWVRNNGSTLISQLLNTILFNTFAFLGTYPLKTLISIILSSYLIFIITSLADTPFIYLCRRWAMDSLNSSVSSDSES